MIKRFLLLLLIAGCAPVPIDFLMGPRFDPSLQWKQIQTDHFEIYFHQGEEETAQKAAQIAEDVHARLVSKIGWTPRERTHLILSDQEDQSNGMANYFPHNTMVIHLAPYPSSTGIISERLDDWLTSVITHEYTHILQLDMATDAPAVWRAIFGRYPLPFSVFINGPFPNDLQPLWLIEGFATDEETGSGGTDRANGAYAEMLLRMAILEDHFPTLDQAAGQLESWPGPDVPYLFGARFLDYIRREFGEGALRNLNLRYSGFPFPFWVDTNAKKVLGVSYLTLWDRWRAELAKRYRTERDRLIGIGLTPTEPLTQQGDGHYNPRMGGNGDVVYTRLDPHRYSALRLRTDSEDRFLTRRNTEGTVSFSPDRSQLVFAQLEYQQNHFLYSDLYRFDFKSEKVTRLTQGARLRDPDFHPDGTRLIAVQGGQGKDRLVLYDLQTGRVEPVLGDDLLIHQPRWSPRGDKIALSGWHQGNQDIYILDVASGQIKPIRHDKALDITPAWSPDGRYIVFSSDRTGIYNLFTYEVETGALFQMTNLIGGAFMPEVGSNKVVFSYYHSKGFDLHLLNWDKTEWKVIEEITPEPLPSPVAPGVSGQEKTLDDRRPQEKTAQFPARPYSSWPTLRPRYWVPTALGYSSVSGTVLGFSTGGSDVLGKHQFLLDLFLANRTFSSTFNYFNRTRTPTLHLAHQYNTASPSSTRQSLTGDILFERIRFQNYASLGVGYRVEGLGARGSLTDTGGLTVSGLWDSTQRYPFSISPEDGHQIGFLHWRHRYNSYTSDSWHLFINRYDPLFRANHVLATELEATRGDRDSLFIPGHLLPVGQRTKSAIGVLSYRFPIWNIERGVRTWPFFFHRLHGALFINAGNRWDDKIILSDFRKGVGSELKLNMTVFYVAPIQWVLGIARGMDEGETETYLSIRGGY